MLIRKSKKFPGITLINIFGLSAGIAVFVLIAMWINYETGYDKDFEGGDNVYRLSFGNSTFLTAGEGPFFAENCIEIEKVTRFRTEGNVLISYQDESYQARSVRFADSTVFDLFPYELILGDSREALSVPGTLVLTESIAKKLFGEESPLGKAITINGVFEAVVTGVIKDVDHTFLPIDVLASFVTLGALSGEPDFLESLRTSQFQTYFLLHDNIDIKKLEEKIDRLNVELFDIAAENHVNNVELVNMRDLYFHHAHGPRENHGNRKVVIIFLAISILTLAIACINFINLTIARSSDSATETGIRKVNGASKYQLFIRILTESLILCFVSSILSLTLIQLFLPTFSDLLGVTLSLNEYLSLKYIACYFGLTILTGLIAGIYPALRLSAFNPMFYLKKGTVSGSSRSLFRTSLVIFQFTISTVLVVSVLIVARQLSYIRNFDHGFRKENVIMLGLVGDLDNRSEAFIERLRAIPGVEGISSSGSIFGSVNREGFFYRDEPYVTQFFTVLPGFTGTMGIELLAGRDFSFERPADRLNTCLLNESALRLLEIPVTEAVGTVLTRRDWYITTIPSERLEVIGVVKDFNFASLRDSVPPVLLCWGQWFGEVEVRINPVNSVETLKQVESVWKEFLPSFPFEYRYIDDFFNSMYDSDRRLGKVLLYFSLLAILIASFGLLGLTAFIIQGRTKEIGLRKVHGASRSDVIREISAGFMKWVAISLLIGTPVSVAIMNRWLAGFAYRTGIDWWIFAVSTSILLVISYLTILYYTLKISGTNPVESIKYE